MPVHDESLRAFAERPWEEIERLKRHHWATSDMNPAELLGVAEELRQYAVAVRPEWPDRRERSSDLDAHVRLAQLLSHTDNGSDQ